MHTAAVKWTVYNVVIFRYRMTSLVWRRLHILKPHMKRAGVTSMTRLRISSPLQVRNALDQMMGKDRRPYTTSLTRNTSSTVALPVEAKEERRKVAKKVVNTQEDLILEKMLYKLDLDMRNTGRVLNHELEKVVKNMEQSGSCTANQALLVLRCCGEVLVDRARQDRAKLLDRYIGVLKKSGVNLDVSHYNTILRVSLAQSSLSLQLINVLNLRSILRIIQSCLPRSSWLR